jgi:predicted DNA binding CopG/RHH family protein
MSDVKLDKEETKLLKAVEAGEFESVLTKRRRAELVAAAKSTTRKDKRINIRISNRDLMAIQLRAAEEGVPYQTLVSSVIHKYISGSLKDVAANKRMQSSPSKAVPRSPGGR